MAIDWIDVLRTFQTQNNIIGKGQLSAVLQLTVLAKTKTFPLDPKDFLTKSGGQVAKLSGSNCNKILLQHGVTRRLASEAGRTSRGTINIMEKYVSFLNGIDHENGLDFEIIEQYWVERIQDYFNSQPFVLNMDVSYSLSACFQELFEQVRKREPGNTLSWNHLTTLGSSKIKNYITKCSF